MANVTLVEEARQFLRDSIKSRVETGAVLSAVLDLGVVAEDSPSFKELSRFSESYLRSGGHQMNAAFRPVDRLSESTVTSYGYFFSSPESTHNALRDALEVGDDREYVEAVKVAVRSGLDALNVPGDLNAGEVLQNQGSASLSTHTHPGFSKNRYKKAVRFLSRVEETVARIEENITDREATICGKSRLSYLINVDELDDKTLSVAAYLTARANRRSVFGMKDQSKAFDSVHNALVGLLDDESNWFELAKVYPTGVVFKRLDDSQLGELLGVFYANMEKYGLRLGELYEELPERAQKELITIRGTDSSRWNSYSGGYNTMRSAWVNLTSFLKLDAVFESFLPGKAPRIMAADLMYSRVSDGQEAHKDSDLFFLFAKPWEVLAGEGTVDLEEARKHDGWAAPLKNVETEAPSVEPALVHGVVVSSPAMAEILRKTGVFAGAKAVR